MVYLSNEQINDLVSILDIDEKSISRLADEFESKQNLLSKSEISKLFRKYIDGPQSNALESVATAIALYSDRPDESVESVMDALKLIIEGNQFDAEKLSKFADIRKYISRIVSSLPFYCSIKSSHLNALLDRHIHNFKAVVAARPIFDDGRENIFSTVIYTNISIITSDAAEQERHLTFSVGQRELQRIIKECNRALRKLKIIEAQLSSGAESATWIYGRQDD